MKDKLVVIIALCGLLVAGIYLLRGRGNQSANLTNFSNQSGKVVIVFGESLTGEQGAPVIQTFPSRLAKLTGLDIRDMTRTAETTKKALERIESVTSINPNYVLVTLGSQDLQNQIDLKETLDNLAKIFVTFQASGAAVVYLSIIPPAVGDNWAMALKDIVKEHGVLWVDDIMIDVWNKPEFLTVGSLPNEQGHEVIAARLQNILNF